MSERVVRAGVGVVVGLALAVVAIEFPSALGRLHDRAEANARLTPNEQLIAAAGFDPEDAFLVNAVAFLPDDATYVIDVGPNVEVSTPLTRSAIIPYTDWLLLPRRHVPVAQAEWLLCYGCDPSRYGEKLQVVWTTGGGVSIGKLG
jgi:hypothetical protein